MVKILNEVGYESYSFKIQENALGFFFNSLKLWDTKKVVSEFRSLAFTTKFWEIIYCFRASKQKIEFFFLQIPNTCELQRKIEIYLSDVIPLLNAALKHNLQSQIIQIYNATGHVVQTISSLIYVKVSV